MVTYSPGALIGPMLGALLIVSAQAAAAQAGPPDSGTTSTAAEEEEPEADRKRADILFAPVPFSSPATGTGIAGGVIAFYKPQPDSEQWISGVGVLWSTRGSKGIAAYHQMSLRGDDLRINARVSYLDLIESFYGVGAEDGDRGDALELRNKSFETQLNAQVRLFPHGFVGARYRLMTVNAAPDEEIEDTAPPPTNEADSTLSMLGPTFTFDTRDSQNQPRRGWFANAAWLFGLKPLGNSFRHNKLTLGLSTYGALGRDTVIAGNARLCSAGGSVPYYDLCLFGSNAALRGYPAGRYRDKASWALQAEVRQHLIGRFGGVVFVGAGGIAPSLGRVLSDGNLLPAAGAGVRYRPFRGNDVQLRLDFAVGDGTRGIYLGIGEAF